MIQEPLKDRQKSNPLLPDRSILPVSYYLPAQSPRWYTGAQLFHFQKHDFSPFSLYYGHCPINTHLFLLAKMGWSNVKMNWGHYHKISQSNCRSCNKYRPGAPTSCHCHFVLSPWLNTYVSNPTNKSLKSGCQKCAESPTVQTFQKHSTSRTAPTSF